MPTLHIEDMHCQSCVARIDKALRNVPGVTSVTVSLPTHTAKIEGPADPATIIQALEKAGYHPRPQNDSHNPPIENRK